MRQDERRVTPVRAREFPIQRKHDYKKPYPLRIPWEIAERAYSVYANRYGHEQSLERLADRGGFSPGEMDMFLPGWLDEVSAVTALKANIERLRAALEHYADEKNWEKPKFSLSENNEWWFYRWGGVLTSHVFKRPWDVARAALASEPG